jgi:hypothetical protein
MGMMTTDPPSPQESINQRYYIQTIRKKKYLMNPEIWA